MLLRISLILAILVGAGTIFVTQKMAREHFTAIRDARNAFETEKNKQTARADKSERDHTATKGVLTTTKDTLAKTEEELNGTKQQLSSAQDSLAKVKAELAKAIEDRKNKEGELAKWEVLGLKPEQVKGIQDDLKKSLDTIVVLDIEKKVLIGQVAQLDNKIKLLIGEDYQVPLPAGTKGNVLAVDPKWNFVVLDIGSEKGILEGGVLMVHRNSQLVGKVRIRDVMPTRCVANVMVGWKLGDIEEGDQVLY